MKLEKRLIASTAHGVVLLTSAMSFAQKAEVPNPKTPSTPSSTASEQQPAPLSPAVDQGQTATNPTSPAEQAPQIPQTNVANANTASASVSTAAPAAAAPQLAPAEVAPVQPAPLVKEPQPAAAPVLPNKLALFGDGWVQVGALLQGWFDNQWRSDVPAGAPRGTTSTFRIRRAELKLAGDIVKDVASFMVTFDPASTYKFSTTTYSVGTPAQTITTTAPPGNTTSLKLFWVSLKSPYVDVALGQFKYPISYEGQASSAELAFPERAFSSRYFGDTYDMGIRLEKSIDWFKYQVFLLNGTGQNQVDTNLQKDLAARIEFTPIEGFTFGGSGVTSVTERTTQPSTKDKAELFGRLNKEGFLLQGELIWGLSGVTGATSQRPKARGRYVLLGYTIAGKLQPVIRWGFLDTNATLTANQNSSYPLYSTFNIASDGVRSYEAGLNYLLRGNNLKLQAAYGYYDFHNVPKQQELTVSTQAMF